MRFLYLKRCIGIFELNQDNFEIGSWLQVKDGNVLTKTLPNVLNCFCEKHPMTSGPIIERFEEGEVRNIALFGLPGSGTTVVLQVVNHLAPSSTVRSHELGDSCPMIFKFNKIIYTIRNPFDVFYSMARRFVENDPLVDFDRVMKDSLRFMRFNKYLNSMKGIVATPDVEFCFLRYEDFFNNELRRVEEISNFLNVDLSPSEFLSVASLFSVDENIKRMRSDKPMSPDYLERLKLDHVGPSKGAPGSGRKLSKEIRSMIYAKYRWYFDTFNYENF